MASPLTPLRIARDTPTPIFVLSLILALNLSFLEDFPNILKCRELVCNIPALKEHYKDEDPAGIRGLFKA